jgi:N6-adenosine-specific RNA methylase IME4
MTSALVSQWADRITAAFSKSVEAFFKTGRLLIEAKKALDHHGEWLPMIESGLPFKPSTAQRLMKIAADERLTNAAHVQLLPPHWGTLYELTKLTDDDFEEKIRSGAIHPELERRDVARENRLLAKARDEERVLNLEPAPGRCRTLVIDPPWDYEGLSIAGRAAPKYKTMTQDELLALDVEGWAEDDCHLYLWTTNNFAGRAHELMGAWGFDYKTMLTWLKPRWGLGSYFRNQSEHALFGVRGELGTRSDSISTVFEAPLGEHSEKPEQFYEIVRAASYPPYGEAFQREARADFANLYRERVTPSEAAE